MSSSGILVQGVTGAQAPIQCYAEPIKFVPTVHFNRPVGAMVFVTTERELYQAVNETATSTGIETTWQQIPNEISGILHLEGNSGEASADLDGRVDVLGSGSIETTGDDVTTLTIALTGLTEHAVLIGVDSETIGNVGPSATAGQVLQSGGPSADPAFSTATYPGVATSTGTILRADGTNWVATTATYPATTTIDQILYSSANNVVSGLATANQSVLTTGATGTPVLTALATDGQLIIGSTAGVPAAATLTAGTGIGVTNGSNSITIAVDGAVVGQTITGNSGGALSPTAGNWNILGASLEIETSGSGSTLTIGVPDTFSIGASTAANSATILSGTGGITLTSSNGDVAINSGTGSVSISSDAANTTVGIANGAAVKIVTLGSTNGASSTLINCGTGGLAFSSANGAITANSGTGTINISNDGAVTTINIGTGGAQKDVTLGSLTGISTTTIQAGSGGINLSNLSVSQNVTGTGNIVSYAITNLDNTDNTSAAALQIISGGASAGDAYVDISINGGGRYLMGVDNSDSDNFKISTGGSLGSSDLVTLTSTGNMSLAGSLSLTTAATQISLNGGAATDFIGSATLVNGTVTVANTNITAADVILVTREGINGSTALGVLDTSITASTSFSITALNPTDGTTQTNDVSTVKYVIFRQT